MDFISRLLRRLGLSCGEFYYKIRYKSLKREYEQLKVLYYHRLSEMEKKTAERLKDLEAKLKEMEAKAEKNEVLLKVIDSLEPHNRRN